MRARQPTMRKIFDGASAFLCRSRLPIRIRAVAAQAMHSHALFAIMMTMNMEHCWPTFMGATTPLEFMYHHKTESPEVAVRQYMATYPKFFGIVLNGDWKKTFQSDTQYNHDEVAWALMAYLEDHRAEWDKQLARIFSEETQAALSTSGEDGEEQETQAAYPGASEQSLGEEPDSGERAAEDGGATSHTES